MLASTPSLHLSASNALAAELDALGEQLHAALTRTAEPQSPALPELGRHLIDLTRLQDRLREHVTAARFVTLERIHAGLARLRSVPTTAQLVPKAVEELARCCDFDRTMLSSVRGSCWRAEAVWITPDHDPLLARRISEYVTGNWIHLANGVLETELVRRRVPILVQGSQGRRGESLMAVSESPAFVAAPIVSEQRVVGFLHADCVRGGRPLTTLDRDNIASFAEGFGVVFERVALLERLEMQRARVHDAFDATERELSGLNDAATVLCRRECEPVAAVPMTSSLRKIAISSVDQLLTVRERQVVELMVQGARNRQIADQLVIAEATVKSHVRCISRKLRASGRADAVSRYLQLRMREQP